MPKVDSKGRIVLPQEIRERLGISPGTSVEVHEEEGKAVVEPEDKPEQILNRMDQIIEEAAETRSPTPYGELDPIAKDHADTVQRRAQQEQSSDQ
ncbi:AbrB/MazE/SpoVT family DNA-binding domain-containing protein [Halalkalicoccus paucihalophilus]|uniref:AbrB/MazE/SpoVT family DNA-binding domain-containing protein n=1 Tax=Halalkalicoccus paucihalophilus TaxID=1008153 RepID=UPI0009FBE643|nr:AbrB/MazE/SpoVT family DNA-binding domain-containing protein [Halalkalicoccus paucihalophilus]